MAPQFLVLIRERVPQATAVISYSSQRCAVSTPNGVKFVEFEDDRLLFTEPFADAVRNLPDSFAKKPRTSKKKQAKKKGKPPPKILVTRPGLKSRPVRLKAKTNKGKGPSVKQSRKPTPFNTTMADGLLNIVEQMKVERELDATRGRHILRETGTGQFGSYPSHDDYE